MRTLTLLAWVGSLGLAGCTVPQGPTDSENTAPPVNALENPAHPGIEACATGNLETELAIAKDFQESCHEMVICGGLSAAFTISIIEVLFNAASGDATGPDGFVYVGKGRYAAGTRMEITLKLANDTTFGKAGDVIDFDVFEVSNYFLDATLKASASIDTSGKSTSSLSITFSETGPGFELLGLEADANGVVHADLATISKNLGENILLETKILMNDVRETSTVGYQLSSPATKLGVYVQSGPMDMQLVSVSGQSSATGQVIAVKDWAMQYKSTSSSGTLDGSIDLLVTGGAFDYGVKYTYPHRKEPDVALSCAGK